MELRDDVVAGDRVAIWAAEPSTLTEHRAAAQLELAGFAVPERDPARLFRGAHVARVDEKRTDLPSGIQPWTRSAPGCHVRRFGSPPSDGTT